MANQLSEFIKDLAIQTKFDIESDNWKTFIEKVKDLEIPEGFGDSFHSSFMTIDSAKNNGEVNNHFKAKHLSAVDNVISKAVKALELDETKATEFEAETDTLKRVKSALALLDEATTSKLAEAKNDTKLSGDEQVKALESLNEKIKELNTTISTNKEDYEGKLLEKDKVFEQKSIQSSISDMIGSYELATSENLTAEDIKTLVHSKLNNAPYIFKQLEDGTFKVYTKEDPAMEAFDENKPLDMKGVVEKIVSPYVKKNVVVNPNEPVNKQPLVVDPSKNGVNKFVMGNHADHNQ